MQLILASSSPRRAQILRDAFIPFAVLTATADEIPRAGESAVERVRRLAEAKARAVLGQVRAPAIVVGADTEVVLDGKIFSKPASPDEAHLMLRRLSGRTHEVITGVFLVRLPDGATRAAHEITRVTFAPLTEEQIAAYLASEEHHGKAGAYAIQGRAGRFVTRIEGCYFNVVGLPLARLCALLKELGWKER
jgi:septum formation protein